MDRYRHGQSLGRQFGNHEVRVSQTNSPVSLLGQKESAQRITRGMLALCSKAKLFAKAYDFAEYYRTSNTVDRLMDYQDRVLYAMKYFHSTVESARAIAGDVVELSSLWTAIAMTESQPKFARRRTERQ
jgi:hypothetical protein